MATLEELHAARTEALEDYINLMEGHRTRLLHIARNAKFDFTNHTILIAQYNQGEWPDGPDGQSDQSEIFNVMFVAVVEQSIMDALNGGSIKVADQKFYVRITGKRDKEWMAKEARPAFIKLAYANRALKAYEKEQAP